tara:strand:+ start:453 stop:899 length:447 start_codon:yes stop_codon:yes gene_type:complete
MASTLKKAPLRVSIMETYSLNGRDHVVESSVQYADIMETASRIANCPGSTITSLYDFGATRAEGQFQQSTTRYVRVTNLETPGSEGLTVGVEILGSDAVTSTYLVTPGSSFILTDLAGVTGINIDNNNAGSVDVEGFVATAYVTPPAS